MTSVPYQLTHLSVEDVLIKIWGITDKDRYELIQNVIDVNTEQLNQGYGIPQSPNDFMPGKLVLVLYEDKYHRAEIIRAESLTSIRKILIRLIDIGSLIFTTPKEIRTINVVKHLNGIPDTPLAEDFILHGVVASRPWSKEELIWANRVLQYHNDITIINIIANKPIVHVTIRDGANNSVSFSQCLINRALAEQIHQEQYKGIIYNKYGMKVQAGQFHVPPPNIQPRMLPTAYPQTSAQYITTSEIEHSVSTLNHSPGFVQFPRMRTPRVNPKIQVLPQQFGVETLLEGSMHEVYVSHVLEGMQSFTVQLKKYVDEKLTKLMAMINNIKPEPFTSSLLPGTMCLGKFSEDKSLCRAVVSTVLGEGAHLYFVDFGNSEIVPFNEIYKIPPEFIQENVMALRFTLANLSNSYSLLTQEAQNIFTNLVMNAEKLIMQVTKPEMPLKQYCELFLIENGKSINIKQRVLDKVKLMKPAEFQKIPFKQNNVANVIVSFVESPIRFFVQLEVNQTLLEILMKTVEEYCTNSEMKDLLYSEDVNENMAVCAQFSEDNKWYRGLITDEPDDEGNVPIFYVDYGNQELAHFTKLRVLNNEMISKFPMQAIECRLDIDANLAVKDKVISTFVEMVDANSYTMQVKNVLPANILLVDLIDEKGHSVLQQLLKIFEPQNSSSMVSTDYSSKSIQSQGSWRERNNSFNNDGDFSAFRTREDSLRSKPDTNSCSSRSNSFSPEDVRNRGRNVDSKKRDFIDVDETDLVFTKKENFWSSKESKSHYSLKNSTVSDREELKRGGMKNRDDSFGANKSYDDGSNRRSYKQREENRINDREDGFHYKNSEDGSSRKPYKSKEESWKSSDKENMDNGNRKSFKPRQESWKSDNEDSKKSFRFRNSSDEKPFKRENWKDGFNRNDNDRRDRKSFRKQDDYRDNKSKIDNKWKNNSSFDKDDRRKNEWGTKHDKGFRENKNKWDQKENKNFNSSISLMDGYEKDGEFIEITCEEGQQMDVVISWFVNPVNFFVMPTQNEEFRQLMEKIQTDYPKRKPVEIDTLSPNDCVVARDKENVIYRAKFLRMSPRGALVHFIDYGNNELVKQDQIWTINVFDCVVPVQAIYCGLYNILPAEKSGQLSLSSSLDKYFGKNKYTVVYRSSYTDDTSSKIWLVDLIDEDNQNISDLLVADGLAVRNITLNSENLYDISLLKHQILTVFPGHIESSKKFFVHIEPPKAEAIRQSISTLVENSDNLKSLPPEKIIEGEFCLAPAPDEQYYRSLILSCDQSSQQARILYIDYGDENDVSFNLIKVLPDQLMIFNSQIVECSLYEGESFTDDEAFIEALEEKDFIIKVVDVIDERLLVYIYDINGSRLPYPVATEEIVPVLCPLPILRNYEKVVISHIDVDKVYVQRSDEQFLLELRNKLNEKYEAGEQEKVHLSLNTFYAAKSRKFKFWYRCIFLSESNQVFYIDYGNTESVEELISVRPLEKMFHEFPACCVGVHTAVKITTSNLTQLIDVVGNIIFDATFERKENDEWFVELKCEQTGKSFVEFVVENNCGIEEFTIKSNIEKPYIAFENWQLNTEEKVVVAHINSPTNFYIQSFDDIDTIQIMQKSLQIALKKVLPVVGNCEGLCAVQKSNGNWYRAFLDKSGKAFTIDYGFSLIPSKVKKLPKTFLLDASRYIVECSLNVELINDSCSANIITRLADLVSEENEIIAKLEFIKKNKYLIDLIINGTSFSEMIVNENLAKYRSYDVVISHAESLNKFYVQDKESEDQLYDIAEQLTAAEDWESVEVINVGDIVAAQFVDDNQWYRAVVTKIENNVRYVRLIDYGNEIYCEKFRILPDSLKKLPSYAFKCSLHPLPENVEELNKKFIQFVNTAEGSYTAYFLSRVESMLVMLYFNGILIEEAINQSIKNVIKTAQKPIDNVTDIVYDNVVVTHINTPSSFYVQAENTSLSLVEKALLSIENAETVTEPVVGDIVAALFPADGLWYRAKIINFVNGIINVLFIDYGNSCIVEQLRHLPDSIRNIPYLAKHCAFLLPDNLHQWPDIAKERFSELTCGGNTIFKFELKEEGDPAFVYLQDNGFNVVDELATLCKADLTTSERNVVAPIVIISHVQSLTKIWIQEQTPQLDEMVNDMANAEFDMLNTPTEGMLVAALFNDDGGWYRAKIIKIIDSRYQVLFIDYGNESETTEVKSLPEDLINLPPLAKCCRLKELPSEVTKSWSNIILTKLQTMVHEGITFSLNDLIKNETDEIYVVSLKYEDNKNLATELINYCETIKGEIIETEPKIMAEKVEITESVANNPENNVEEISETMKNEIIPTKCKSILDQDNNAINEMDVLEEEDEICSGDSVKQKVNIVDLYPSFKVKVQYCGFDLGKIQMKLNDQLLEQINLTNLEINSIVAAISVEDGIWYRAKIMKFTNSEAEVLLIDYDKIIIATEFAKLPAELLEIPPVIQEYLLNVPDYLDFEYVFTAVKTMIKTYKNDLFEIYILNEELRIIELFHNGVSILDIVLLRLNIGEKPQLNESFETESIEQIGLSNGNVDFIESKLDEENGKTKFQEEKGKLREDGTEIVGSSRDDDCTSYYTLDYSKVTESNECNIVNMNVCDLDEEEFINNLSQYSTTVPNNTPYEINENMISFNINADIVTNVDEIDLCDKLEQDFPTDESVKSSETKETYEIADDELFECETDEYFESAISELSSEMNLENIESQINLESSDSTLTSVVLFGNILNKTHDTSIDDTDNNVDVELNEERVTLKKLVEVSSKSSSINDASDDSTETIEKVHNVFVEDMKTISTSVQPQNEVLLNVCVKNEKDNKLEFKNTTDVFLNVVETITDDKNEIFFKQNENKVDRSDMIENMFEKLIDVEETNFESTENEDNAYTSVEIESNEIVRSHEKFMSYEGNILKKTVDENGSIMIVQKDLNKLLDKPFMDMLVSVQKRDEVEEHLPIQSFETKETLIDDLISTEASDNKDGGNLNSLITNKKWENYSKLKHDDAGMEGKKNSYNSSPKGELNDSIEIDEYLPMIQPPVTELTGDFIFINETNSTPEIFDNEGNSFKLITVGAFMDNEKLESYSELKCDTRTEKKEISYNSSPKNEPNDTNFLGCKTVSENKIEELHSSELRKETAVTDSENIEKITLKNDEFLITHVNNPDSFFVQRVSDVPHLFEIEKQLRGLEDQQIPEEEITVDMIAGAKIQNLYLRVKVLEVDNFRGYVLLCIDYGNESSTQSLFRLTEKLKNIPPMVMHCSIPLPSYVTDWPENVCEQFDEITMRTNMKFGIKILGVEEDTTFVKLFRNGVDINKKIEALCREFHLKLDEHCEAEIQFMNEDN